VLKEIAEHDWVDIQDNIKMIIDNVYSYRNSIYGILNNISNEYSGLSLEAAKI
jgi:hypothetical protein